MLEVLDTHIWSSSEEKYFSPQLDAVLQLELGHLQPSASVASDIGSPPSERSNCRAFWEDWSYPRGVVLCPESDTCMACHLLLLSSPDEGIQLFPCGHGVHTSCRTDDICSQCLMQSFRL